LINKTVFILSTFN